MYRPYHAQRRPGRVAGLKIGALSAAGVLAVGLIAASGGAASAAGAPNNVSSMTGGLTRNQVNVSFKVLTDTGPSVTDQTTATASSVLCNNCKTVAIAVTIDVVSGPVTSVSAPQYSLATNHSTTNSNTLASDAVYVVAPGTAVTLTSAGRSALNAIGAQVSHDANTITSAVALQTQLNSDLAPIPGILASDVVPTVAGPWIPWNVNHAASSQIAP
jgi:hypothetical protein